MTQVGTWVQAATLCFVLVGCYSASSTEADAGACASARSPDAAATCEAQHARKPPPAGECRIHSDCVLVARGCCGSCLPPSKEEVLAVPSAMANEVHKEQCPTPVACGSCAVMDPDPLSPLYAAGCVDHRCKIVDLRSDEISRCDSDSDCAPVSRLCCPAYSSDPANYVGVNEASDRALLECFPVPPCIPPDVHPDPVAFCAPDGHCAVRRRETE